jgi:hypothetical protein
MERLFSPCTRHRDILATQGRLGPPEWLQELNLDVSTEELLSAERAFTYADLYAMLGNADTVAWLTPHASVARSDGRAGGYFWSLLDESCCFYCSADGKEMYASASSPEHLLEICNVIFRLLAASVVHSVILSNWRSCRDGALINAPLLLAYMMEQCQSLKFLSLKDLEMDENQCRALGTYSRPGLEIELIRCELTRAGTSALTEVLGRNQGPTKLYLCNIDNSVLADGLRGNSRLKSLTPSISSDRDVGNRELLAIADALRENKGLVYLDLEHDFRMSDETWDAFCDSLKTHPTLQILDLTARAPPLAPPAVIKSRIQALVDMMKVNISIHTIRLDSRYSNHELFRGSVIPVLQTNRFRTCVRAIQKTRPIDYRAKVLGRALVAVRTDPNRFWMLLSGNPEVAFSSTTATTTPVASLPTSNATVSIATAAVTATATWAASTTDASAAGNVATPTTCQKCKARP